MNKYLTIYILPYIFKEPDTSETCYSLDGRFEWNVEKDKQNFRKHGILFEEIISIFYNPMFFTDYDINHSSGEDRYYGVGNLNGSLTILVFFTIRDDRTRIISARQADKDTKEAFNEINKNYR